MTGRIEAQNEMVRQAIERGEDPRSYDEYIKESNAAMEKLSSGLIAIPAGMLAWGLMVFIISVVYQILPMMVSELKIWLSNPFYRGIAVLLAVVFACGLLIIKTRWLITYSLLELAFGVATLYDSATNFSEDKASFLVMFAAMYILVRGFENLQTGYKARREQTASVSEDKA